MPNKLLTPGFGIYCDSGKTTSGQRFFGNLCAALDDSSIPLALHPKVILFNISAPWREIVKAKWRGQKVVIRVDGLYFDRLSTKFIDRFRWPLRVLFRLGLIYPALHEPLAHIANMFDQNYKGFLRILLADHIIYQSHFSKRMCQVYFPKKSYSVVVNGAKFAGNLAFQRGRNESHINLITVYDEWRLSKRLYDVLSFVCWANKKKSPVRLTVLGYTNRIPVNAPSDMRMMLEDSEYVQTLPKFSHLDGRFRDSLLEADCYITFSFRDSCPNVVVESMAHGLPVVGLDSGGIADIVGNAGRLISANDFPVGFFSAHRFDTDYPSIDFEQVYSALCEIIVKLPVYRERVALRFNEQLDIDVVAKKYKSALEQLI